MKSMYKSEIARAARVLFDRDVKTIGKRILNEHILRGYTVNQRLLAVEERMDRKFSAIESELRETGLAPSEWISDQSIQG